VFPEHSSRNAVIRLSPAQFLYKKFRNFPADFLVLDENTSSGYASIRVRLAAMNPEVTSMLESEAPSNSIRTTLEAVRYIRFASIQVDQQRQEVTSNGTRLRLQGKVYQVLLILLEKPGEVVTREELRHRLWPAESQVNYDANVNTTVNKLRQALGDSSDNPVYIETIPRRGYCFLMQVELSDQAATPGARANSRLASPNANRQRQPGNADPAGSGMWIILGVIGLILAGMLLGAGLTKFWMSHLVPGSPLLLIGEASVTCFALGK
jgi:DNA-binding winged helix-turn-helix (wHTH) protein